jgi:hypothetical protein
MKPGSSLPAEMATAAGLYWKTNLADISLLSGLD